MLPMAWAMEAESAPPLYRFECGVRYPGGYVDVRQQEFTLNPGDMQEISIDLDPPAELPREALVDRQVSLPEAGHPWLPPQGRFLFVVHDNQEPSVRTLAAFERFASMSSRAGACVSACLNAKALGRQETKEG